jgi:hypothetical protein
LLNDKAQVSKNLWAIAVKLIKDNNSNNISIGDSVKHRFRDGYSIGVVERIEDGVNAVCWVDFDQKVLGKKHLTICTKFDIVKVN